MPQFNCNSESSFRHVATFDGDSNVSGVNINLDMELPSGKVIPVPFFAKEKVSLNLYNPLLGDLLQCLYAQEVPISPSFPVIEENSIKLVGVLGNDVIEKLEQFNTIPSGQGRLIQLADGFIPIGSPSSLMAGHSSSPDAPADSSELEPPCISESAYKHSINFVMEPKPSYFSAVGQIFPDSSVEQGLEHMFSVESLGISEDSSSYDDDQVSRFQDSIELRDGSYYVELPWKQDLINKVPSNFELSKVIARKVSDKNSSLGISDLYNRVFEEQEELGIIKRIPGGFDPQDHVFISH